VRIWRGGGKTSEKKKEESFISSTDVVEIGRCRRRVAWRKAGTTED
jgi:hypothetical protein